MRFGDARKTLIQAFDAGQKSSQMMEFSFGSGGTKGGHNIDSCMEASRVIGFINDLDKPSRDLMRYCYDHAASYRQLNGAAEMVFELFIAKKRDTLTLGQLNAAAQMARWAVTEHKHTLFSEGRKHFERMQVVRGLAIIHHQNDLMANQENNKPSLADAEKRLNKSFKRDYQPIWESLLTILQRADDAAMEALQEHVAKQRSKHREAV